MQPHEGVVEVAASIRLETRRRAMAASFDLDTDYRWRCQTIRVL
ncbi:Rv3235 family protein [Pseudonocardia xishanensis]